MKFRPSIAISLVTLTAGFVAGALFFSSSLVGSSVQAKSFDADTADKIYQELGAKNSPLVHSSNQLAKIAELTTPSVVHIQSERENNTGGTIEETGSGIIIKQENNSGTFVVTNRHVVIGSSENLSSISIHLEDGRVLHPQRLWTDQATDIAIMKVSGKNLPTARWGNSDKLKIGHMVLAMGSPFGFSRSVTLGIISAKGRRSLKLYRNSSVLNQDFLQTDAAINPGNSGGPLIDLHGQVIGINTAIASNSGGNDGIGFSIPSNMVKQIVSKLLKNGSVQRAYLGVKLDPDFDEETAGRLKLDRLRGARVTEVYPNTPASRVNLKFDDVILSFDGIDVQDENHLINLVSLTDVDNKVRLSIQRNGKRLAVEVVLAERPSSNTRSEAPPSLPEKSQTFPTGLSVVTLDGEIQSQLGITGQAHGLLVTKIDPASSLVGKIKLYDVILEVGRQPVKSLGDFQQALKKHATNSTLVLKISRVSADQMHSQLIIWNR